MREEQVLRFILGGYFVRPPRYLCTRKKKKKSPHLPKDVVELPALELQNLLTIAKRKKKEEKKKIFRLGPVRIAKVAHRVSEFRMSLTRKTDRNSQSGCFFNRYTKQRIAPIRSEPSRKSKSTNQKFRPFMHN